MIGLVPDTVTSRVGGLVAVVLAALALASCGGSPTQASGTPAPPSSGGTSQTGIVAVLRVNRTGTGTGTVTSAPTAIDCGDTCAVTFLSVTEVTLTAVPDEGSTFEGFEGDPDCVDGQVTMSVDVTCSAVFDLIPPPMLAVTDFVAFGDSFTYGIVSTPVGTTSRLVGTPQSYPTVLEQMLSGVFTAQSFEMDNRGNPGERVEDSVARLPEALASRPDVMLVLHGVNNLDTIGGASSSQIAAGISEAAAAIDTIVRQGQAAGAVVFLATLPPQRPARDETAPLVPILNTEIVAIAASRQAVLVNLFAGLDVTLIGSDGLHPTEAGYRRIAELFYAPIVDLFELPEGEVPAGATDAAASPSTPPALRLRRSGSFR